MINIISKVISVLTVLVFAFAASAQSEFAAEPKTFFIELIPDSPGPQENVRARLSGFAFDLNRAQITWVKNGRAEARGLGLREFSFATGNAGERINLRAVALDQNGIEREAELLLTVAGVDLLWRAETSVPLWYKGKTIVSPKSFVSVSAFPQLVSGGRKIPSQSLIFRWGLDDIFQESRSGAGKNIFRFTAGPASGLAHQIDLEVSDIDGEIKAAKTILIPIENPQVLVYEEDPLIGTKTGFAFKNNEAIIFAGEERTFRATPFFFSLTQGRSSFEYLWRLNDRLIEAGEEPNLLRLRSSADARGRSALDAIIKNANNILQEASQSFNVNVL